MKGKETTKDQKQNEENKLKERPGSKLGLTKEGKHARKRLGNKHGIANREK